MLIIAVTPLTGRLYSLSPKPLLIKDHNLPSCGASDPGLLSIPLALASGKPACSAFPIVSGVSLFRVRSRDRGFWELSFAAPPFRSEPLAAPLMSGALCPLEFRRVSPWQQNGQSPPEQKRKKTYSPSATSGSPGHIFWVVPAFKVNYGKRFRPLTPKEKFGEWAQSSYDPMGLSVGAFEAGTLEYSPKDGLCGYGKGWGGYGQCYGSLELDATDSSFIGDFVLPVLLHQDPRYFRLG